MSSNLTPRPPPSTLRALRAFHQKRQMSSKHPSSLTFYMMNEAVSISSQIPWHVGNLLYLFRDVSAPLNLTFLCEYSSFKVSAMQNFLPNQSSSSGNRALPMGSDGFLDSTHLGSKAEFSDNFKALARVFRKCIRFLNLSPDMGRGDLFSHRSFFCSPERAF